MTAIDATTSGIGARTGHAQPVPNSAGIEPPKLKAPANACDCHHHIYDPARFPMPPSKRRAPSNGAVADYRLLQKRIGTARSVVVQPRNYATDNRVTIDALAQLAPNSRGIVVVHPTITDAELKSFNDAGVRGRRHLAVRREDQGRQKPEKHCSLTFHNRLSLESLPVPRAEGNPAGLASPKARCLQCNYRSHSP